jgi:hypothetical protein
MLKALPTLLTVLTLGCATFSVAFADASSVEGAPGAPQVQEGRSDQKAVPERLTRRMQSMQKRLAARQAMLNQALEATDIAELKRLRNARKGKQAADQKQPARRGQQARSQKQGSQERRQARGQEQRAQRGQRVRGQGQEAQQAQQGQQFHGEQSMSKRMRRARAQYSKRHGAERGQAPSIRQGLQNSKAPKNLREQSRGKRVERVRDFVKKARGVKRARDTERGQRRGRRLRKG